MRVKPVIKELDDREEEIEGLEDDYGADYEPPDEEALNVFSDQDDEEEDESDEDDSSEGNGRSHDPAGRTLKEWAADQTQFAHLPQLPPGWIRVKSKSTGSIYYCSTLTGETSFEEPKSTQAETEQLLKKHLKIIRERSRSRDSQDAAPQDNVVGSEFSSDRLTESEPLGNDVNCKSRNSKDEGEHQDIGTGAANATSQSLSNAPESLAGPLGESQEECRNPETSAASSELGKRESGVATNADDLEIAEGLAKKTLTKEADLGSATPSIATSEDGNSAQQATRRKWRSQSFEKSTLDFGPGIEDGEEGEEVCVEEEEESGEENGEEDMDYAVEENCESETQAEPSEADSDPNGNIEKLFLAVFNRDVQTVEALVSSSPRCFLEKDLLDRSALQVAVLKGFCDIVKIMLSVNDAHVVRLALKKVSSSGDSLLHLALSVAQFGDRQHDALGCVRLLIQAKAKVNALNNMGRSPLHVACLQGSCNVIDNLLMHNADTGMVDQVNNMPLHYAIDSHNSRCIDALLITSDPVLFTNEKHPFYRIIESQAWEAVFLMDKMAWPMEGSDKPRFLAFAENRGLSKQWEYVQAKRGDFIGLDASQALDSFVWPSDIWRPTKTALVTHTICFRHGALPHEVDDPFLRHELMEQVVENPNRLEVLCGSLGILRSSTFAELQWKVDPSPAAMVDLLRVHEFEYLHHFQKRVREFALRASSEVETISLCDVRVSKDTWEAARSACGCVLHAVDEVISGAARNAFCVVRPPGHHLGPQGAVGRKMMDHNVGEGSQGFCILNNVAVGAAYALCTYRKTLKKVAILDFDVHHGNGTEAIVRNVKEDRWCLQDSKARRVPIERNQMGLVGALELKLPQRPACKPWLDPASDCENIFFASIHGFDEASRFYPGSGQSCREKSPQIINVALPPRSNSKKFREALDQEILPALESFNPDLIFLSAGFDGHTDDPVGNCDLSDEDYVWITRRVVSIANSCCEGRIISTLEGGYNTMTENVSPLALSVAGHVRTLMRTSPEYRTPQRRDLKRSSLKTPDAVPPKRMKVTLKARKDPSISNASVDEGAAVASEKEPVPQASSHVEPESELDKISKAVVAHLDAHHCATKAQDAPAEANAAEIPVKRGGVATRLSDKMCTAS